MEARPAAHCSAQSAAAESIDEDVAAAPRAVVSQNYAVGEQVWIEFDEVDGTDAFLAFSQATMSA